MAARCTLAIKDTSHIIAVNNIRACNMAAPPLQIYGVKRTREGLPRVDVSAGAQGNAEGKDSCPLACTQSICRKSIRKEQKMFAMLKAASKRSHHVARSFLEGKNLIVLGKRMCLCTL
jgi:hypothetical protein